MILITANVSNALVRYGMHFGRKPTIGEISTSYTDPEVFVAEIDIAIENDNPIYGRGETIPPKPATKKRKKKA